MNTSIDPRDFWNRKILTWEKDRYEPARAGSSVLEAWAKRFSGLPARMANARKFLLPRVAGRDVVELGCGSGLLAEEMIDAGAKSYRGFDVSDGAVAAATARVTASGLADRISFTVGDVSKLPALKADIVYSLGTLDWLTPEQIQAVFRLSAQSEFLHSFSERSASPWRYAHALYVYVSYGHSTGAYVPQYHSMAQLQGWAKPFVNRPLNVFRDPAMRFGAFVTTFPTNVR